jgi:hypothetical protein
MPLQDKPADSFPTTERNGRKTLTTVQGLPKKFDQKKILKVIKKKFGMYTQQAQAGLDNFNLRNHSLQWHHCQRH